MERAYTSVVAFRYVKSLFMMKQDDRNRFIKGCIKDSISIYQSVSVEMCRRAGRAGGRAAMENSGVNEDGKYNLAVRMGHAVMEKYGVNEDGKHNHAMRIGHAVMEKYGFDEDGKSMTANPSFTWKCSRTPAIVARIRPRHAPSQIATLWSANCMWN